MESLDVGPLAINADELVTHASRDLDLPKETRAFLEMT
jgi:hypothetical protein